MEKRNICLAITQIRSHVNFGNNLREARAKKRSQSKNEKPKQKSKWVFGSGDGAG